MTQDQRNSILERLSPLFVKAEKAFEEEIEEIEIPTSEKENNIRNTPMFIIGFVASFLGVTAMTIFWLISENSAFPTTSLIIAFVGSLAAIVGIFSVYRLRESPEEPNARSAARSAIDFESDVIRRFTKSNIPIVISSRDSGYDFLINVGDKKILIEVKSWHRRPSINLLKNTVDRLSRAVQNQNAYEGIIVTKEPLKLPSNLLKDAKINFMSLTELRNYITHDLNILR